jgi:hypothetical protein
LEIVEQNFLVRTQHAGDFLQRFEARAHGAGGPCFQTGCGPGRVTVESKVPGEPSIARRSGMGQKSSVIRAVRRTKERAADAGKLEGHEK